MFSSSDVGFADWMRDTYRNTIGLFRENLAFVTFLMLFINFAIQFG